MKKVVDFMADGADYIRDNIYRAMANPILDYLPGYKESTDVEPPGDMDEFGPQ